MLLMVGIGASAAFLCRSASSNRTRLKEMVQITINKEIHPGATLSQERKDSENFVLSIGAVSVQLSSEEERPETAVKAWKRHFLMEFSMS